MTSAENSAAAALASSRFKEAMARFPAGVTVNTTVDADGKWWGFTASAFCSLSAEPPLVLVCIAKSAECYPAFMSAPQFAVHFVPPAHSDLARTFATRGADKFANKRFSLSNRGLPVASEDMSVLECSVFARHDGGDHTILVGQVEDAILGAADPVVYYRRDFHRLPLPAESDLAVSS